MTSAEIRRSFIDFFVKRHAHTFVPSSPVVPLDDPTLLFTNAGMNQFKPIFLGAERRPYNRAVNSQKCIRAGGKHNDLDDVGRSRRHHTFFEMLGNWSFGDYFKEGAIRMSWELLTEVWGLDPTRIHVTCHAGDPANGVQRDDESADIWHKLIGIPLDRIHYGGKDNFWEMGETGPCGPCTEIFYDRTPEKTGGRTVLSGEDPRVMEIWNDVFIQFNRNPDRSLSKLPARHVDTGMGFERISQIIQGKQDNYGIDLFAPLFSHIAELSKQSYGGLFPAHDTGVLGEASTDRGTESPLLKRDIAFRVIADHARMASFAITDGAKPDNKGRDSVVRSVIRRAVRFGYQQFDLREPFLFKLVDTVASEMGEAFGELRTDPHRVAGVIEAEEKSFLETIDRGLGLFEEAISRAGRGGSVLAEDAFDLHTTYGFPPDLQIQMAQERGLSVDLAGYERLFGEFREQSGKDRKRHPIVAVDLTSLPPTDDSPKYAPNTGHSGELVEQLTSRVIGVIVNDKLQTTGSVDCLPVDGLPAGGLDEATCRDAADRAAELQPMTLLLERTNFYAEQGGQVGDTGTIAAARGIPFEFEVTSTQRRGDHVLHVGTLRSGSIVLGNRVYAQPHPRINTQRNHTATHILNYALRLILGDHVQQKGSLVDGEKFRFDFSHDKALTSDQLAAVEYQANYRIQYDLSVFTRLLPLADAKQIAGVRAVFGENYPDPVRVVSIGCEDLTRPDAGDYSIEFCGGTHLDRTGRIGLLKIVEESAVAKGVRRITALTGTNALAYVQLIEQQLKQIAQSLSTKPEHALDRITALQAELKEKKKAPPPADVGSSGLDPAKLTEEALSAAATFGSTKLIVLKLPGATQEQVMTMLNLIRKKAPSYAAMFAMVDESKVGFLAAVSDDVIATGLSANDWIRETSRVAGGSGGGKPPMAQAGGRDPGKTHLALKAATDYATAKLG